MSSSWKCPFCLHIATIQSADTSTDTHEYSTGTGRQRLKSMVIRCPNADCKGHTLEIQVVDLKFSENTNYWLPSNTIARLSLIPDSFAKPMPGYLPEAIVSTYTEACRIRDLSPKASATLSRRCLQGMIRDFWGITKRTLKDEIDAIEDKVDAETWQAIDSVRKIGNIGAHMERDIDVIIDVEPHEAELLIGLIETLVDEWYVARNDRKQRMAKIAALAVSKDPKAIPSAAPGT
jgi:Domain of unknown function (DUF4145)